MYDLVERRMYNVQGIILENECAIEALKVGQWGRENKTEGKRERERKREYKLFNCCAVVIIWMKWSRTSCV